MSEHGYRQVGHAADLAVRIWAPTEEALLAQGAAAIAALLTGQQRATAKREAQRRLELSAVDPVDRMVRFLNEVLALAQVDGFLVAEATIGLRGDDGLDAELWGEEACWPQLAAEIKAVTYHGAALTRRPGRVEAAVVMDV